MVGGRGILQAREPRIDALATSLYQSVGECKQSRGARGRDGGRRVRGARVDADRHTYRARMNVPVPSLIRSGGRCPALVTVSS